MKKWMRYLGTLLSVSTLLVLISSPASARTIGVEVDGKTYTFSGGAERYEIDGKIFLISDDEVIVQRPGESDLCLLLSDAIEEDVSEELVEYTTMVAVETEIAEGTAEQDSLIRREWDMEDAAEYAVFAPYGLSCDAKAGKLYFMGTPVRVFEDAFSVDGGTAELSYFDEDGKVDVRALRDDKGELTGLEALSEAEFISRDLREWTDPAPAQVEMTASSGTEPTPEERASFFEPYASFGLRYDAKEDRLYFHGRPVRNFLDVRSSNGESPTGGNFHGSLTQLRFDGEVDVTTIRDYAHPDVNGEGKLLGLEIVEYK